jgi:peroxiredoxin
MKRKFFMFFSAIALASMAFIMPLSDSEGYKVGDFAKDFKLKNIDGSMVSMASDANAKGYIVIFTCNSCPYAKMYEDRIVELNTKYAPQGYPVIAIMPNDPIASPEDSFEKMIERAAEKNFNFPYLIDETQEITREYGATRTPHVYLLNKERDKFKVAYIGAIDDNYRDASQVKVKYVEDAIEALKTSKSVQNNYTKAIGCTIKWKKS